MILNILNIQQSISIKRILKRSPWHRSNKILLAITFNFAILAKLMRFITQIYLRICNRGLILLKYSQLHKWNLQQRLQKEKMRTNNFSKIRDNKSSKIWNILDWNCQQKISLYNTWKMDKMIMGIYRISSFQIILLLAFQIISY